ncbi:MAG: TIGR01212 family radical SAM protein [Lachnospiraceae bacterium]|nr:TIGR01212 family radical SAM protein [Lachnospiraceae bacterium]
MEQRRWGDKPYYSLDHYLKSMFGRKIYKVALNAGCTCPVRDGTLDTRGCIFCSEGGSGEFAASFALKEDGSPDVEAQLEAGLKLIADKYNGSHCIAYLQPYSNTYGDTERLERLYHSLLSDERVAGLSIATRPDCLPDEIMRVLKDLKAAYPEKLLWVELGLQTIHRKTVKYIRRGYETSVFEDAVHKLSDLQIPVIVHVILGLPGETAELMYSTIEYLNTFRVFGIKLQLLHVLRGTDLAADYEARNFDVLTLEEYVELVIGCLERIDPEVVIHRVTGDGPADLMIAPMWSRDKKRVLNMLHARMDARGSYQGKLYFPVG